MSSMERNDLSWAIFGKVYISKLLRNIVLSLQSKAKTQRMISQKTCIDISRVNKSLFKLARMGIVYCKNPENCRGKFYGLTNIGEVYLNKILEYEGDKIA